MSAAGGNRKSSSPSDDAYWARAKAANFAETHKAKRVKRHINRMAKKAVHKAAWLARQRVKALRSGGFQQGVAA